MAELKEALRERWEGFGGWKEFLAVSFPLILSASSVSLQHFINRLLLSWYAPEAIAAAMTAGVLQIALMSIFVGTAGYTSTFVAQYYGAARNSSIGPSVWQGLYVSLAGGIFILATAPFAKEFFDWVGHPEVVSRYETAYYTTACWGAFPAIASAALAGYFSGQGRTWPVLAANIIATVVNLLLAYSLIFGVAGMPMWGVAGAAVATNIAFAVSCVFYILLMMKREYRVRAPFFSRWRPNLELLMRFLRFGFPAGAQVFVEIAGFAIFLLLVGRLGTSELTATTIAFNISNLAFMPMLGFGLGVSVLVGQAQGEKQPDRAARATWSGLHFTSAYMVFFVLLYILVPDLFIMPFARGNPADFEEIRRYAIVLLRFIAAYSLFDTLNIVFAGTLKGAGDTRFIIKAMLAMTVFFLILPTAVAIFWFEAGLYTVWTIITLEVCLLGVVFMLRFLSGKWKKMLVIENAE